MNRNILLIAVSLFISTTLFAQQEYINPMENATLQASEEENPPRPLSEVIEDHHIVFPESMTRPLSQLLHDWQIDFSKSTNDCRGGMNPMVPDSVIIARLQALPTEMEMTFNSVVRSHIDAYAGRRRDQVAYMLALGDYYFPMFAEALDRYGLPLELKYLPVIESALNPIAVSRMGATGLWQFMLRTGQGMGLEVSTLVDERRDPYQSTDAAARYLRDLYTIYEDWNLAIAAYNCGPGNVNRAIARSGGKHDYWEIYHRLPRETRGYVPAFIAAVYVMNYHEEHNICPVHVDHSLLALDTIHINEQIHFNQIAETLDVSISDLRRFNPKFRRDIIPASEIKPYALVLPTNLMYAFVENADEIFGHNRSQHFTHRVTTDQYLADGGASTSVSGNFENTYYRVRSGDNLSVIAQRNRVSVAQLRSWNNLNSDRLSINQRLIVGRRAIPQTQTQIAQTSTTTSGNTQTINQYYRVRSGDTLNAIAGRHGTTVAQIQQWNGMSNTRLTVDRQLIVGQQVMQIEVPEETEQEESTPENITNESSNIISNFIRSQIEEVSEESEENENEEEI
ncbi:MAG: transglycosylase SLT domain-containing protein [Dysgonamonadaceae bacterium]|jgi:membrane-bound lytic murein transglycosylase D|nr:transglycosylase SLT domain-containing protein [Dysgonamonadaceae bacterium]